LSSRIIYFIRDKLYWSCFTTTEKKENSDPKLPQRQCIFQSKDQRIEYISMHWKTVLSDYIKCSITFDRDRLMAIDRITRKFEQYYCVSIFAGILDNQTGRNLLWFVNKPFTKDYSGFRTLSWSWISLAVSVSFSLAWLYLTEILFFVWDLRYKSIDSYPINKPQTICWNTYISGQVLFTGILGKLIRISLLLNEIKVEEFQGNPINNNEIINRILDSAVFRYSPLQSYNKKENKIPTQRQIFVPAYTELLINKKVVLGFLIPDRARSLTVNKTVFCTAVQQ